MKVDGLSERELDVLAEKVADLMMARLRGVLVEALRGKVAGQNEVVPEWVTTEKAVEVLGCSRRWLYYLEVSFPAVSKSVKRHAWQKRGLKFWDVALIRNLDARKEGEGEEEGRGFSGSEGEG